jgi:hypothetical protein
MKREEQTIHRTIVQHLRTRAVPGVRMVSSTERWLA